MSREKQKIDWKDKFKDVLKKNVKSPYDIHIEEFMKFIDELYEKWWNADIKLRGKYAYNMNLLMALSDKTNVIKAKLNAYYAYLVYRGYTSAYKLMKNKVVAGGESIYTWLRMYRELLK